MRGELEDFLGPRRDGGRRCDVELGDRESVVGLEGLELGGRFGLTACGNDYIVLI